VHRKFLNYIFYCFLGLVTLTGPLVTIIVNWGFGIISTALFILSISCIIGAFYWWRKSNNKIRELRFENILKNTIDKIADLDAPYCRKQKIKEAIWLKIQNQMKRDYFSP